MDAVRKLREELLDEVETAVDAHAEAVLTEDKAKRAMIVAVAAAVAAGCDLDVVATHADVSKGTVQRWAREADKPGEGEIPGQQQIGEDAPASSSRSRKPPRGPAAGEDAPVLAEDGSHEDATVEADEL